MSSKQPYPNQATIKRLLEKIYGVTLDHEIAYYYSMSNREATHRGWKTTCKYLKDLYTQAQMISLGLEPEPIPFRKSDKRGIAKALRPFRKLLKSKIPNHKRAALTVLRLCYLIYCDPEYSTISIVEETRGNGVNAIIGSFTAFAGSSVPHCDPGGSIEIIPRAKAGPNGSSSLMSSHLDAVALSQRPQLLEALQELADIIDPSSRGSPRNKFEDAPSSLTEWVQGLTQWAVSNHAAKQDRYPVSRLSFLAEGGCKTRVIAIGDLFSQAIYLPLHDKLMKRLRSLDQDATHDQGKAISWLKEKTTLGGVWSFDLTTATDRFPASLQRIVLSAMFGQRVGELWETTMSTLRDFSFKDSKGSLTTDVYYKVGQPMGLYSSWPAFAYTHHIFVQWCASLEGVKSFKDYRIIGDDVVIANERVANRYRSMLEELEVPISKTKSIVSINPPYCGEIAKRLIHAGIDISPIPPELIKQVQNHVTMIPALIDEIGSRYGLDLPILSALPSLESIFRRRKIKEKASILLSAPSAFALGESASLYGKLPNEVTKLLLESTSARNQLLGPWAVVNPEVFTDIGWIQEQTRKVFLLSEYERVYKEWNFFHPNGITTAFVVPGVAPDYGPVTIETRHPLYVASTWLECKLHDLFSIRVLFLGSEDEVALEDFGLQYCLDPTLRSYREKRQTRANIASHLTLETFKVLTGRAPMPQVEHPVGGLLEAQVRITAH
jgi:hypothetical protein